MQGILQLYFHVCYSVHNVHRTQRERATKKIGIAYAKLKFIENIFLAAANAGDLKLMTPLGVVIAILLICHRVKGLRDPYSYVYNSCSCHKNKSQNMYRMRQLST